MFHISTYRSTNAALEIVVGFLFIYVFCQMNAEKHRSCLVYCNVTNRLSALLLHFTDHFYKLNFSKELGCAGKINVMR